MKPKLRLGTVPECSEFEAVEPWIKAKEPKAWVVAWIISGPLSIVLGLLFYILTRLLLKPDWSSFSFDSFIIAFVALLIVHELVHALFNPDKGISSRTIFGFWPSKMMFYAHYEGERTRENFLLCLVAPFLALSVLPLMIGAIFDIDYLWLSVIIILNAFISSVDIYGVFSVFCTIPSGSLVRNKGWYTYWKKSHNNQFKRDAASGSP